MLKLLLKLLLVLFLGNIISSEMIELKKDNFVSLRETINQDVSSRLLLKLNAIENKHDDIYIYINSPGGEVIAGLEIINYIKSLQQRSKNIICICHNAMSMAFTIFQFCSKRYILYSSTLMQHQMSLSVEGKLYDINSRISYINTLESKLNKDQAERLNMTTDNFVRLTQNDWWLYSDDIIKNKAADKVISFFCSFDNYDEQVIVQTILGDVKIIYSACPLINYPISITYPKIDFTEEKKKNFINRYINFIKKY
jgi:ATP-dependent Clp protease protease subunit